MRRTLGAFADAESIAISHVVSRLDSRGATIDEKIKALDAKLLELKAQIAKARGYATAFIACNFDELS